MRTTKWVVALGLVSACVGTVAHADDAGIYAGGSLGQVKTDFSNDILNSVFDGKDSALEIFLGYRVRNWLGFEAGYYDLGEITLEQGLSGGNRFWLKEKGLGAFGMLYWPLAPVDLFARGGFILSQQHLRTDQFFGNTNTTDDSTDFAWGVGAQVHIDKLAVRLEYERFEIDARPGFEPPEMISLGASWTFF